MTQSKKHIWFYLLLSGFVITIIACNFPQVLKTDKITITSVPPDTVDVDISPFQNIGCTWQSENYAVCPEESVPKKMGCDSLSTPAVFLNLIDTNSQFVNCSYAPELQNPPDGGEPRGLYNSGCSVTVQQRLLTYKDGDYLLISDLEDLKYYFSPIDTADKALGYAIAATGYSPFYSFEQMENYRILVKELEPTHVESSNEGYEINLFDHNFCGCGPHTYQMKRLKISTSGDVEILESIPVFENPEEDDLCVD